MIIKSISYSCVRQIRQYEPQSIVIEAELSPEVGEDGKQKEKASDVLNSLKKFAICHLYLDVPAERDKLLVQMLPKAPVLKTDPSQQSVKGKNRADISDHSQGNMPPNPSFD